MDNVLKLTKTQAVRKMKRLGEALFTPYNVRYTLSSQCGVRFVGTIHDDTGHATFVTIGTREVERGLFHSKVSDIDFARVILNMYHEQSHCMQKNQMFRQPVLSLEENNTSIILVLFLYRRS